MNDDANDRAEGREILRLIAHEGFDYEEAVAHVELIKHLTGDDEGEALA